MIGQVSICTPVTLALISGRGSRLSSCAPTTISSLPAFHTQAMNGSQASKGAVQKSPKRAIIRAHICPPSQATHPCDRWETAFVYTFIIKFTNLRAKIEGFEGQSEYVFHNR